MITETKEERMLADDLTNYIKDKHTQEECIGFIDGYKLALSKVKILPIAGVGETDYPTRPIDTTGSDQIDWSTGLWK